MFRSHFVLDLDLWGGFLRPTLSKLTKIKVKKAKITVLRHRVKGTH
jgi:hypothetical protein